MTAAAVGVLGPVLLTGPDGAIRIGSARQRRLLAALVAHLGAPVDTGVLADLVWDEQPADPAGAVQTNIARLRRLLPPGVAIATVPEGYQLVADRSAVDVAAFADHLAAGDLDRLEAALGLWRGPPYVELDHPAVQPKVARLTELRLGAMEQLGAALLASGRVGEAVAALEALTRGEPLREGAVALLMRALVAAGRQGDALAAFARLRARLLDELGLDPSPELRDLERQVLNQQIAAPVTPSPARAPRLPVSSFVGRDADLERLAALLSAARVVTLCGPGGVGKTRLALHAAAHLAERYADGVLVVELGDGGPADVEPAVAAALRLADPGGPDGSRFAERIVELLAPRRLLLVLDNCEHVADEVAALAEAITAGTAAVDLLLTSREPMRADGEHVQAVAPLDPASAARLLADRIRAGDPAAVPGPADAGVVAELCHRLDGLPLALELAAARALPLGLPGLLEAMDRPLDVLRGGRRTAAGRHRSLRDVVAWSHGLLDPGQRVLFERMAVFAGPVERSAVEAVCGGAHALPDLVERSLVVRHAGDPARFGMLETLRAFGRSRLAADPAGPPLRARHAAWAVGLAGELAAARRGPGEAAAVRRFDDHLADLRRAHAWLCEHGPAEDLLRLALLFAEFGYLRCRVDLVRLVEEALAAAGDAGPLAARLHGLLAAPRWQRGDLAGAQTAAERALEIAEAAGDPLAGRDGAEALANVASFRGDLGEAARWARRSAELAREAGDTETEFFALLDLMLGAAYTGDDVEAMRHETAMEELLPRSPSPTMRAILAYGRGERRAERGDPGAAGHLREAIDLAEQVDSRFVAGIARHTLLTSAARSGGEPAGLLAGLRPLIEHWQALGAWTHLWIAVRALAGPLSRLGRHDDVAVLLGALHASPHASRVFGADAAREEAVERAARAALGPAFAARQAEGAALGDAGAVALALALTRPPPSRLSASPAGTGQDVRFAQVDGRQVAWSATGEGPPLVLGGWWVSHLELDWHHAGFRALVERLARHRTVIRYDRPGTGLSGRGSSPTTTLAAEAAVLAGVLDAVAEELDPRPVALWGVSSGGPVAALHAARHPDRVERLVLYGSYADGSRVAPAAARASLLALVADHWGLGSRVLADVFLPAATPAERDAFARFQRDAASPAVAAGALAAVYTFDVRDLLPRVRTPTLVLHRTDDRAIPVALGREVAALVPGAEYRELAGADHYPWRGDGDAVVEAVLGFLGYGTDRPRPPDKVSECDHPVAR